MPLVQFDLIADFTYTLPRIYIIIMLNDILVLKKLQVGFFVPTCR